MLFTCRVSPNRMQRIGIAEPQPKAMVRPKMMRKASRGVENLNWGSQSLKIDDSSKSHQLKQADRRWN